MSLHADRVSPAAFSPRFPPSRRRLRVALLAPLVLAAALGACSNPPYPRGSVESLFPTGPKPELKTSTVDGQALHRAEMPGPGRTPILFVHGSPGDWKAWAHYLAAPELAGYGPRIAVDRPGFGGSQPGAVLTDLRAQADRLAALLPAGRPAIVVGHSLGGPLVAWLAIDHPDKVCAALMIAGSVASIYESPRWYNRFAASWLGQHVVPAEMRWSNREMLALAPELRRLEAESPRLTRPLVALQGERDELVDPRSADGLAQRAPPGLVRVVREAGQGHFILWERPDLVLREIAALPCRR